MAFRHVARRSAAVDFVLAAHDEWRLWQLETHLDAQQLGLARDQKVQHGETYVKSLEAIE